MNPARLLFVVTPRFIPGALLFLHGCQTCPAQRVILPPRSASVAPLVTMPGTVTPALSRTNWFQVIATDAKGFTYPTELVVSADYTPAFLDWTPSATPFPITNYTLLVTRTNANGRVARWTLNVGTNTAAVWPPASVPRSNVVVTVLGGVATAETLDGPWVTNQAVLWQATNSPGSRYWRQTGLSITSTNF